MESKYFNNVIAAQERNYTEGKPVSFSKTAVQRCINFSDGAAGSNVELWADKLLKHMVKGNPFAARACLKRIQEL